MERGVEYSRSNVVERSTEATGLEEAGDGICTASVLAGIIVRVGVSESDEGEEEGEEYGGGGGAHGCGSEQRRVVVFIGGTIARGRSDNGEKSVARLVNTF